MAKVVVQIQNTAFRPGQWESILSYREDLFTKPDARCISNASSGHLHHTTDARSPEISTHAIPNNCYDHI
jgi:hypothetical protein